MCARSSRSHLTPARAIVSPSQPTQPKSYCLCQLSLGISFLNAPKYRSLMGGNHSAIFSSLLPSPHGASTGWSGCNALTGSVLRRHLTTKSILGRETVRERLGLLWHTRPAPLLGRYHKVLCLCGYVYMCSQLRSIQPCARPSLVYQFAPVVPNGNTTTKRVSKERR